MRSSRRSLVGHGPAGPHRGRSTTTAEFPAPTGLDPYSGTLNHPAPHVPAQGSYAALRVYVGLRVAGTGWGHYVTRMPRASKLMGLVKSWALRLSTWSRLLMPWRDSAVGGPAGVVPGEDLVGPGDERVDDVVELGQLAGLVEVAEPSQGVKGAWWSSAR